MFFFSKKCLLKLYFHPCFSFQALESLEFPDIIPLLRPLMHTICLVYSHSTFYNSPARIIVLMTEACNLLINRGRNFLDPSSLFQVTLTLITYYIYALISVECIPNWNKPLIILPYLREFCSRVKQLRSISN